jgi:hypothetical protein
VNLIKKFEVATSSALTEKADYQTLLSENWRNAFREPVSMTETNRADGLIYEIFAVFNGWPFSERQFPISFEKLSTADVQAWTQNLDSILPSFLEGPFAVTNQDKLLENVSVVIRGRTISNSVSRRAPQEVCVSSKEHSD